MSIFKSVHSNAASGADAVCIILKLSAFIVAALRSRRGHYIFALWFLSSIFFFFFLA